MNSRTEPAGGELVDDDVDRLGVDVPSGTGGRRLDADLKLQVTTLGTLPGALDKSKRALIENLIEQQNYALAAQLIKEWEAAAMEAIRRKGAQMEKNYGETARLMSITEKYQKTLQTEKEKHEALLAALQREDEKLISLSNSWQSYYNTLNGGTVSIPAGSRGGAMDNPPQSSGGSSGGGGPSPQAQRATDNPGVTINVSVNGDVLGVDELDNRIIDSVTRAAARAGAI